MGGATCPSSAVGGIDPMALYYRLQIVQASERVRALLAYLPAMHGDKLPDSPKARDLLSSQFGSATCLFSDPSLSLCRAGPHFALSRRRKPGTFSPENPKTVSGLQSISLKLMLSLQKPGTMCFFFPLCVLVGRVQQKMHSLSKRQVHLVTLMQSRATLK